MLRTSFLMPSVSISVNDMLQPSWPQTRQSYFCSPLTVSPVFPVQPLVFAIKRLPQSPHLDCSQNVSSILLSHFPFYLPILILLKHYLMVFYFSTFLHFLMVGLQLFKDKAFACLYFQDTPVFSALLRIDQTLSIYKQIKESRNRKTD